MTYNIKMPYARIAIALSDLGEGYWVKFINTISKIIIVFKFYVYMFAEE